MVGVIEREDTPGSWHHVMNRGVERRTIFVSGLDRRYFLSCFAREVRRERLEIHAYCLLGNHFHLLVRSPRGMLAEGVGEAERSYVQFFNREHDRDGPLFRGRFRSKPVLDSGYRWTVLRYVDANPVRDGVVERKRDYAWSSARHYFRGIGPPWLSMSWVRLEWEHAYGRPLRPGRYGEEGSEEFTRETTELLEARFASCADRDPAGMSQVSPELIEEWLLSRSGEKERHGDFVPLAHEVVVRRACLAAHLGGWRIKVGNRIKEAAEILCVGLLRDLCGLKLVAIAEQRGLSIAGVHRTARHHHTLLASDADYRARAISIGWETVRESLGIGRS